MSHELKDWELVEGVQVFEEEDKNSHPDLYRPTWTQILKDKKKAAEADIERFEDEFDRRCEEIACVND